LPLKLLEDFGSSKIECAVNRWHRRYIFGSAGNMAVRASLMRRMRGFDEDCGAGDTEFVQRSLNRFPQAAVAYREAMGMRHLEVASLTGWLRKIRAYGRFHPRLAEAGGFRGFGWLRKAAAYRHCIRKNRYSPGRSALLLGLLFLEDFSFKMGVVDRRGSARGLAG